MTRDKAAAIVKSSFDSWYSALVHYAHRVTGQMSLAEDLTQDVFLRLYGQLCRGEHIDNPKAWLFCVLRNDIAKHQRNGQREGPLEEAGPDRVAVPAFDLPTPAAVAEAEDLERLFSVLTTREQEIILLRLASLKYREIAARLNISASAVNTMLARAVRKLRRAAKRANWNSHVELTGSDRPTLQ